MPESSFIKDLNEKGFMALLQSGARIVIQAGSDGIIAEARITPMSSIPLNDWFPRVRELAIELHLEMMKEYFKQIPDGPHG
jgi:hypothetical protein